MGGQAELKEAAAGEAVGGTEGIIFLIVCLCVATACPLSSRCLSGRISSLVYGQMLILPR